MRRLSIIVAWAVATATAAQTASGATLEELILGASLDTELFVFDAFSYAPYTGGPAASAVTVLPINGADGAEGVRIAATFSTTSFVQGSIRYRITAKDDALISAAELMGNPMSGPSGFATLDEVFGGGLAPLGIWSQGATTSNQDTTTFAMPRTSFTVNSLFRLSGSPGNPSRLTQFDETFRVATAGADFDGDGDVDGADFLVWQRGLRSSGASRAVGDANGDGAVNAADLAIWQEQFGPAGAAAIPDPPRCC